MGIPSRSRERRFQRRGNEWFFKFDLPSDIAVRVDSVVFHLHKFPLVSRCGRLARMFEEEEEEEEDEEETWEDGRRNTPRVVEVELGACPGGSESFLLAAMFCYGLRVELTVGNIFPVLGAAEYLGMTEDYGEDNLLATAAAYFDRVVLRDWKLCILSLRHYSSSDDDEHDDDRLAGEGRIDARRLVDKALTSLSVMACTDLSLFGWPLKKMYGGLKQSPGGSILWNGIATGAAFRTQLSDWWFEDVSRLPPPLFCRLLGIMKARGTQTGDISAAVLRYARKHIPGLCSRRRPFGSSDRGDVETEFVGELRRRTADQKGLLEALERLLPETKGESSCDFLLGLLRVALLLGVGRTCRDSLERRIGEQLEWATLGGLIIPSFSADSDCLYDTGCAERIIRHYRRSSASSSAASPAGRVAKLVDDYLAEVASDPSVGVDKMRALSEALPANLRPLHDGLYRALDVFLQAHPWLTTGEREQLLDVLDWSRLSTDAYRHASQNERLPMRVTLRVLFFEQLKMRTSLSSRGHGDEIGRTAPAGRWVSLVRDCRSMRLDMDDLRSRIKELEQQLVDMKQEVKRAGRRPHGLPGPPEGPRQLGLPGPSHGPRQHSSRSGHLGRRKPHSTGESQAQLERHRYRREKKANFPLA